MPRESHEKFFARFGCESGLAGFHGNPSEKGLAELPKQFRRIVRFPDGASSAYYDYVRNVERRAHGARMARERAS